MADKTWEREVARRLGDTRHHANSGERLNVESDNSVAQAKHTARFSLARLEALAEQGWPCGTETEGWEGPGHFPADLHD